MRVATRYAIGLRGRSRKEPATTRRISRVAIACPDGGAAVPPDRKRRQKHCKQAGRNAMPTPTPKFSAKTPQLMLSATILATLALIGASGPSLSAQLHPLDPLAP